MGQASADEVLPIPLHRPTSRKSGSRAASFNRRLLTLAALLALAIVSPATPARADPGDVTRLTSSANAAECAHGDDGSAPLSRATFDFNSFFGGITVDGPGAHVYLGDRGFVRSENGVVAGVVNPTFDEKFGIGPGYPPAAYEGIDPKKVPLDHVAAVAVDPQNRYLYIGEGDGFARVRYVDLGANITRSIWANDSGGLAGLAVDGQAHVYIGLANDGSIATMGPSRTTPHPIAAVPGLRRIAVNSAGTLLFATSTDGRVYRIDLTTPTAHLQSLAGGGSEFLDPSSPKLGQSLGGIASNAAGNHLFVADETNHKVNMIDMDNAVMATVVGPGATGTAGQQTLHGHIDLAVDGNDHLYIADSNGCAVLAAQVPASLQGKSPVNPDGGTTNNPDHTGGATSSESSGAGGSNPAPQPQGATQPPQAQPQGATQPPQAQTQGGTPGQPSVQQTGPPAPSGQGQGPGPSAAPTQSTPPPVSASQPEPSGIQAMGLQQPPPGSSAVPSASPQGGGSAVVAGQGHAARGATRYAMVAGQESEYAGVAVAASVGVIAMFVCVVAGRGPRGEGPRAKPRPQGAY